MANRWKGNIVSANATTSDGTNYTGKANGAWGLNSQIQQKQANLWAKSVGNPTAPTIGTATAGNANASVSFTASSDAGASGSLTYTAISTPGSITGTSASSPITVSGLTNGTQYTFVVNATNSLGLVSPNSTASNSTGTTVPGAPTIGTATAAASAATVTFTAPSNTGGLPITGYTVVSTPGSITGTGTSSPVTVNGLTNGTSYTFKVSASNLLGSGAQSSASNSVTPSSDIIAIGTEISPFINAYAWSNGYGSKFANPATLPVSAGMASGLCFNPTNTVIASSYQYGTAAPSAYIAAYAFSSSGFDTKYANPATAPAGESRKCIFSPNGNYLAVPHSGSPFITVYNWSNGFGSKITNPATLPAGVLCYGASFSPTTNALGILSNTEGAVYSWSAGFGTKYSMSGVTPGNGNTVFSADGTQVAATISTSPYIKVFPWTGSGYGTAYTNPATVTTDTSYITPAFSKVNNFFIVGDAAYNWTTSGFGSFIGRVSASTGTGFLPAFNAAATLAAKGVDVYPISSGSIGSKYANPSTMPPSDAAGYGSTCFTN